MRLDEVAKLPSGLNIYGVKKLIQDALPDVHHILSRSPSRMWTRGDGIRYKEPPYLEFFFEADCDKVWAFLSSIQHQSVTVIGPHGSTKNQGILIGGYVFVKGKLHILMHSKQTILRSPVYHFAHDDENNVLWMLNHLVKSGKPVRAAIKTGKVSITGDIVGIDGRELQFADGKTFLMPFESAILYTIKTKDGVPTLVKK